MTKINQDEELRPLFLWDENFKKFVSPETCKELYESIPQNWSQQEKASSCEWELLKMLLSQLKEEELSFMNIVIQKTKKISTLECLFKNLLVRNPERVKKFPLIHALTTLCKITERSENTLRIFDLIQQFSVDMDKQISTLKKKEQLLNSNSRLHFEQTELLSFEKKFIKDCL